MKTITQFFGSFFLRVFYSSRLKSNEIRNILICRTDKLGDVIMTLPLITETKRIFPNSKISFLISNYVRGLLEEYEDIDELKYLEELKNFKTRFEFLRNNKFDVVINVYPRFNLALLFFLARIKLRVGTAYRWYSHLFNMRVHEHRKFAEKHEVDYNLNLLKVFTNDINYEKEFKFRYSDNEKNITEEKFKRYGFSLYDNYIIIHPCSMGSSKEWSIEKFSDYSNSFLKNFHDIKIIYTGSEAERIIIDQLHNSIPEVYKKNIVNLSGKTNLKELMIVIDNSNLFLSNATGPIHLAGALNKKIIGFYPNDIPINEIRWKPLSDDPVIFKPKNPGDSMETIEVDEVIDKTRKILYLKN